MSFKKQIEEALEQVFQEIKIGQTLAISHGGQPDTARVYAYGYRSQCGRNDIKFRVTEEALVCTRKHIVGLVDPPKESTQATVPALPVARVAPGGAPTPATGQLITDVEPTEEILEALHVLMEKGVVQIAEFVGESEEHFLSIKNHEKFTGNQTKRGYAVV